MNGMTIAEKTLGYIPLPNRGTISVQGPEAFHFLQNLISNDLSLLDTQPLVYAALLTAQGKFLHDFFISKDGDGFIVDCEGGDRTADLHHRMNLYKLRAKVTLIQNPAARVYIRFDQGLADPRHPDLGFRTFEKPDLPELDFSVWDSKRIDLAIADGSRDAEIEKSTLAELNMEQSAVSYDKGCYVGQELTARIHFRGLVKRKLQMMEFSGPVPAWGEDIIIDGKNIGEMRSHCGSKGLALMKIAQEEQTA